MQNFVSAASGMAVLVALIRGFVRREAAGIGNFWVDLTRSTLYILLPLSLVLAVVLVSQGVVQSFDAYRTVELVEPVTVQVSETETQQVTEQVVPLGPAASQIAIKQLGTNGGGFFNVNSAHPLENPTPLSNFLEVLSILLISAALCYTFGQMIGDRRQGWALLAAMLVIFVPLLIGDYAAEQAGNPRLTRARASTRPRRTAQPGGNMEGKEARFGIANSALWAVATTSASNGSVNSMHGSFTPLGGLDPDVADAARRGRVRRRRQRALRHDHVRDRRRVHRGPHGRADARVPRQEDRGLRGQDGLDRAARAAASSCWSARRSRA